jgi:SOS response regulatory protein OraA/RecX
MKRPVKQKEAFEVLLQVLAARAADSVALRTKLEAKGFDERSIDEALSRAKKLKYFNDEQFAHDRAVKQLAQGRSVAQVRARLESEGRSLTQLASAVESTGHTDEAAARRLLLHKKVKGTKAMRLLASRGYDEDLIAKLCPLSEPDNDP